MIGLDRNVVVRYLVQDAPEQSPAASTLIEELTETDPGYISLVTVVELHWVLRRAYKVSANQCAELLDGRQDASTPPHSIGERHLARTCSASGLNNPTREGAPEANL